MNILLLFWDIFRICLVNFKMSYSCFSSPKPLLLSIKLSNELAKLNAAPRCCWRNILRVSNAFQRFVRICTFVFYIQENDAGWDTQVGYMPSFIQEWNSQCIYNVTFTLSFFLATYIHKTFEKLSCTSPFPSPLGV